MNTQHAFTLIEILVAMAVIAILAMVALPNLRPMLINNRMTSKTNDFISAINYVRTESITRFGRRLRIQPIDYQDDKNDWSKGWQIVDNSKGDDWKQVEDDGEESEILKIFDYNNDQIVIKINKVGCSASDPSICYKARGRVQTLYEFHICSNGHPTGNVVTITTIGRARTESCSLGESPCPNTCP